MYKIENFTEKILSVGCYCASSKLRNAQTYLVGAGMLVVSYLGKRAQIVRSGGEESFVGA
jgi:hypothetical protein